MSQRLSIALCLLLGTPVWAGPLDGTWKSGCYGQYLHTLTIQGGDVVSFAEIFHGSGCRELESRVLLKGSFTVNGQSVDLNFPHNEFTLFDPEAVKQANAHHICELTNWQLGVPNTCPDTWPYYQIFEVRGDTLYLGEITESREGFTPDERPIEIDYRKPYQRQ